MRMNPATSQDRGPGESGSQTEATFATLLATSGGDGVLGATANNNNDGGGGGGFEDEDDRRVIGQVRTQWNRDARLMQLVSLLFEVQTFGEPAEVPEKVWEGMAKSIFEIENVVLNPFLTTMTSDSGREELWQLVRAWKAEGPGTEFYQLSGELLDKLVQPEIAGEVYPTWLQVLWEYLGFSSRLPWLVWWYVTFLVVLVLSAAALIVVALLPRDVQHNNNNNDITFTVNIVVASVMLFSGVVSTILGIVVGHHNAVMHGIVNFIEVQRLKEILPFNQRDGSAEHNGGEDFDGVVGTFENRRDVMLSVADGGSGSGNRDTQPAFGTQPALVTGGHADDVTSPGFNPPPMRDHYPAVSNAVSRSISTASEVFVAGSGNRPASPGVIPGSIVSIPQSPRNVTHLSHNQLPLFGRGGGGALDEGSRTQLFGLQSALGSMFGMSAVPSVSADMGYDAVRAYVLCEDPTTVTSLCTSLWQRRVCVAVLSDPKDLAAATLRSRSDRFRLFFISADALNEKLYQMLRPMEEAQGLFYFSANDPAQSKFVPKHLVQQLPIAAEDLDRMLNSLALPSAGSVVGHNSVTDMFRPSKQFHIPHYSLGKRLGGGAFGNVFEAELDVLAGRCAVKRMYVKPEEGQDKLRSIAREVDIMSRLHHPNIVQYLFCKREGNCICIFMEMCEGGSLSRMIQGREMSADAVKHYLRQIIEAVMYLHSKQIIHRDLKPENVLFRNGQVKLTDFGTAARFRSANDVHRNIKGTFPFMAPEVLLQEPYGTQCDVWSIGCIAADMLLVPLEHRQLGLAALTDFYKSLTMQMAIEVDTDEPAIKDFLELCFRRDPSQRPTPERLLQHAMLKPDDGSIRKHLDYSRARSSLRRPSLGVQSLRSMGVGAVIECDNEF